MVKNFFYNLKKSHILFFCLILFFGHCTKNGDVWMVIYKNGEKISSEYISIKNELTNNQKKIIYDKRGYFIYKNKFAFSSVSQYKFYEKYKFDSFLYTNDFGENKKVIAITNLGDKLKIFYSIGYAGKEKIINLNHDYCISIINALYLYKTDNIKSGKLIDFNFLSENIDSIIDQGSYEIENINVNILKNINTLQNAEKIAKYFIKIKLDNGYFYYCISDENFRIIYIFDDNDLKKREFIYKVGTENDGTHF